MAGDDYGQVACMPPLGPGTASGAHVFPPMAHDGSAGNASGCCFQVTCGHRCTSA